MRAAENQIPVEKKEKEPEKSLHNVAKTDTLWAELRRLKARVSAIESQTSTLRRDYNRLNSKVYRDEKSHAALNENENQDELAGLPADLITVLRGGK
jgi:hypothetical protein